MLYSHGHIRASSISAESPGGGSQREFSRKIGGHRRSQHGRYDIVDFKHNSFERRLRPVTDNISCDLAIPQFLTDNSAVALSCSNKEQA